MSKEAEQSVLGAVILSQGKVLDDVSEVLVPADFASPVGEAIFTVMLAMRDSGVPIDAITLSDWCAGNETIERHNRAVVIADLLTNTPTSSNAVHYAGIVAEEAAKRRLAVALTRSQQINERDDLTADEKADIVEEEITAARRPNASIHWLGSTLPGYLAALDEPVRMYRTPWPVLNACIGGWVPGRLYIVGARPAVGKSVFGVQAALGLAQHGAVSLSSLEMSTTEVQHRMVANLADVDMSALMEHRLQVGERLRVEAAVAELAGMTIAIDDRSGMGAGDVLAYARTMAKRNQMSGAIVDYLQLMEGAEGMNRQQAVAGMSRAMKLGAKALDIPVIALSQLNREPESRGDRLPTMSDLRESGALEQDADVVILLSRRRMTDETGAEFDSPNEVVVQVVKNRHGPTDTFILRLEGAYARLVNPAMRSQTMGLGGPTPN